MKYIIALSLSIFLFAMGCKSEPPPPVEPIIIVQDPLVLQEITPLPRSVVIAAKAAEFEPIYTALRIIEVSEVNGVQKYFLVRLGSDRTGISVGVTGDIAEDAAFQKIIGNYKILEVYADFFRCEIVELAYRIGTAAYMRVQTGEKLREDTPPA
jgi:hypothetical protein